METLEELTNSLKERHGLELVDSTKGTDTSMNEIESVSLRYRDNNMGDAFITLKHLKDPLGRTILRTLIDTRDLSVIGTPYAHMTKSAKFGSFSDAELFLDKEINQYKENQNLWKSHKSLSENLDGSRKVVLAKLDTDESNRFQTLDVMFKGDTYTLDDMLQVTSQTFIDICKALSKEGKLNTMDKITAYLKTHWFDRELKGNCSEEAT